MLPTHVLPARGEAPHRRQRARDLLTASRHVRAPTDELIDRPPNDRSVGGFPPARLTADCGHLSSRELDLLPFHATMMA